jgi:hypothetical protein
MKLTGIAVFDQVIPISALQGRGLKPTRRRVLLIINLLAWIVLAATAWLLPGSPHVQARTGDRGAAQSAAKGVESISCDYRMSKRMDQYGNRFRYKAKISIYGRERWAWDVFFVSGS